jgi:hypothetical protein
MKRGKDEIEINFDPSNLDLQEKKQVRDEYLFAKGFYISYCIFPYIAENIASEFAFCTKGGGKSLVIWSLLPSFIIIINSCTKSFQY